QGAADGPDAAVQRQLADHGGVFEPDGGELAGGGEEGQGDGQVEGAGVLLQVGGREVDDGAAVVSAGAEVDEGAFDTVDALADGGLGQADHDRLGQPAGGVHLGLDSHGVDADQGERVQLRQHGAGLLAGLGDRVFTFYRDHRPAARATSPTSQTG